MYPKDKGIKTPRTSPGWYPGLSKDSLDRKHSNKEAEFEACQGLPTQEGVKFINTMI